MSKCSVFRTLKSKCSHWTLLRPKYCALSDVERKRRKRKATANLRIERTSPLKTLSPFVMPRCESVVPASGCNATPAGGLGCCEEVNGLLLCGSYLCSILKACTHERDSTP